MRLISGSKIADQIKQALFKKNQEYGLSPVLAVILVGKQEDSDAYVSLKQKAATAIGGSCQVVRLAEDTTAAELLRQIQSLNDDAGVNGIILQLPLPPHLRTQQDEFLSAVCLAKDVDGFNPLNRGLLMGGCPIFVSCAALAVMEVVDRHLPDWEQCRALLIGDSFDLILPLTALLVQKGCRVEVVPVWEPSQPIAADLIVIEKGSAHIIRSQHLVTARLLVDAGFYWDEGMSKGNVDKEALADLPGDLLSVPGGMGPLLIAKLMENLSRAARDQLGFTP